MKCDQADSVRYIEPTRGQAAFAASSVLPLRHSQNCPFLLPPPNTLSSRKQVLKKRSSEGPTRKVLYLPVKIPPRGTRSRSEPLNQDRGNRDALLAPLCP